MVSLGRLEEGHFSGAERKKGQKQNYVVLALYLQRQKPGPAAPACGQSIMIIPEEPS